MIFKIVTLDRSNRKADRSISMSFTTSTEQSTQDLAELDMIHQRTCVIAIKPDESGLNKDYGHKGKGVVNPAILTISTK